MDAARRSPRRTTRAIVAALAFLSLAAAPAAANPLGGQVVGGQATIATTAPGTLTIQQATPRAAINWQSFNIAPNETTQFVQPSASATALNRVQAGDPSIIAGRLNANGQVVLINPSGVVFAHGSQVNVNSLIATPTDISTANFMAGKMVFDIPSPDPRARIVNNGTITVAQKGLAALVGPSVANNGVINARLGTVLLGGAQTYTLDFYGDGLIKFDIGTGVDRVPLGRDGKPVPSLVSNSGLIDAPGGTVLLSADAASGILGNIIDAQGTISAPTYAGRPGSVTIDAGPGNGARLAGAVDISGLAPGQVGGSAVVTGRSVALAGTARIDARGDSGGGTVKIGGGPHGADKKVRNALSTSIAAGAVIDASATNSGNGGTVAVWSDGTTTFDGAILAKGGPNGGDGGWVETSGHLLSVGATASVVASAPKGAAGTWLLDPWDTTISNSATSNSTCDATVTCTSTGTAANVNAGDIGTALDSGTDVTITTGATGSEAGNITVSDSIFWFNPTRLTLNAAGNIAVNASIIGFSGGSTLTLTAGGTVTQTAFISVGTLTGSSVGGATLTDPSNFITFFGPWSNTGGGALTFVNSQVTTAGTISNDAGDITLTATFGNIGLNNDITAAGHTVTLNSASAITQAGGVITAATLGSNAAGGTSLGDANAVGSFNAADTAGAILLVNTASPLVLTGVSSSNSVTINNTGAVSITGTVSAGNGTAVNLTASGAIGESGSGLISTTGTLTTSSAGGTTLGGANTVSTLSVTNTTSGDVSLSNTAAPLTVTGISQSGGGVVITNTGGLTTTGAIGAGTGSAIGLTTLGAGNGITLGGNVVTATGTVTLTSAATIGETAPAAINAASLITSSVGGTTLFNANTVGAFDATNSGSGNIALFNTASPLSFTALSQSGGGGVTISNKGDLSITGALTTTGTLFLSTIGSISQNPGAIITANGATFTSSVTGGTITLNEANKLSGSVALNTSGSASVASLTNAGPLTTGFMSIGGNLTLTTTGAGSNITIASGLFGSSTATTLTIHAAGAVSQTTGSIFANSLTGTSVGGADFGVAHSLNNTINNFGPWTDFGGGNIALVAGPSTQILNVNGGISTSGNVTILAQASGDPDLDVNTTISGATVSLFADGKIVETAGGSIIATNLIAVTEANPGGNITLDQTNIVTGNVTLASLNGFQPGEPPINGGTFLASGTITFNNTTGFTIAAATTAFPVGANVFLEQGVSTTANATLNANGPILETGIVIAANLQGSSVGGATLNQANLVAVFGPWSNTISGALNFADNQNFNTQGAVSSVGDVLLSSSNGGLLITIGSALGDSVSGQNVTLTTDSLFVVGTVNTIGTGAGTATVRPVTAGLPVTPGTASAPFTALGLTQTEIDQITATTLVFGSATAGGVTVSPAVAPAHVTNLTLVTGAGITLAAGVTIPGTLTLTAAGAVTQPGGAVSAATLAGSAASAALNQAGNTIAALGTFTTSGDLGLVDNSALSVSGAVTTGGSLALQATTGIAETGSLSVTGPSSFTTTAPNGSIILDKTNHLTGAVAFSTQGTAGNVVLVNAAATTLAAQTVNGDMTVTDADSIAEAGIVKVTGKSSFTVTGNTPGTITLDTFGNQLNGAVSLNTAAGAARLQNAVATTLGASTITGGDLSVTTTGAGSNLSVAGSLAAAGHTITLNSSGAITQPGGAITADQLLLLATGSATLAGANAVKTLAASTAGLAFTDAATTLTVGTVGAVNGITATSGIIGLSTTLSGDIVLNQPINAGTGSVSLTAAGAITQNAGAILTAKGADFTANGGGVGLAESNQLSGGVFLNVLGDAVLRNAAPLTLGLSGFGGATHVGGSLTVTTTGAGSDLTLVNNIFASNGSVFLTSAGAISHTGLDPFNQPVFIETSRDISMNAAAAIQLSGLSAGSPSSAGNVTLIAGGAISSIGINSFSGTIGLNAGGAIQVGAVTTTGAVSFISGGTVTQNAGTVITAGTLTGSSVGGAALNGANMVGAFGGFVDKGAGSAGISFTNAQALTTVGTISSDSGKVALTTTAGDLVLGGNVIASNNEVKLASAGGITQLTGFSVDPGSMLILAAGSVSMPGPNTIDKLAAVLTGPGSTLTFNNTANNLAVDTVEGVVGITTNNGAVRLSTTTSGNIALNAGINTNPGTAAVSLTSAGTVTQTAGIITAATLTGSSVGGAVLNDANKVGTFGGFSDTGALSAGISFTNAQALSTSGTIGSASGPIALTTTAGGLTLGGNLTAAGSAVVLNSAGAIDQAAGVITTTVLTGSSVGGTDLDGANQVGSFFGFANSGSGNLGLVNAAPLVVGAVSNMAGDLTLTTMTGGLLLAGDVTAAGTVNLTTAGGITQPAGVISGNALAVIAGLSVDLPGSNLVKTLAASVTGSGSSFDIRNAETLTIGTVGALNGVTTNGTAGTAANILIATTAGDISITQAISTNGGNGSVLGASIGQIGLQSAGKITESGAGSLIGFALEALATGDVALGGPGNRLGGNDVGGIATTAGTVSGQITGPGSFTFIDQNAPLLVDHVGVAAAKGVEVGSLKLASVTGVSSAGGAVTLVTAKAGDILVNQPINGAGGLVTVAASGNLTIGAGGAATGGSVTLATLKNFTNNAGGGAIAVGPGGRWLVYSTDPGLDSDGGLVPAFIQYAAPYDIPTLTGTAPALAAGNAFLYSLKPTLSLTSVTKIYDGTTKLPTVASAYTAGGLVPGDNATLNPAAITGFYADKNVNTGIGVTVTGGLGFSVTRGGIPVFGYTLGAVGNAPIGTITPAALTITAADRVKTYGQTLTLGTTAFTAAGLLDGDLVSGVTLASNGAPGTAGVGSYAVVASAALGTGLGNYTIGFVNGTLTVTPAVLTITAADRVKIYGQTLALGTTAFTAAGLVNGDTVTGVTLASAGAPGTAGAGVYAVAPSAALGTGLANYTIGFVNGTLTVTPAVLTITAADRVKTYGQTLALGTTAFTAAGLVNGDTVTGVTLASPGAPGTTGAGVYAVAPSAALGTGLANYTIGFVNGTLTVNPAVLTAGLTGTIGKTYDGTTAANGLVPANYLLSGILNGDDVGLNNPGSGLYASPNVGTGIGVSVAGLALTGSAAKNYVLASNSASGNIGTISPITLTVDLIGLVRKEFDGTTAATLLPGNYKLSGVLAGEGVVLNDPTAGNYATPDVGTGKPVSVSGLAIAGPGAGNYVLASTGASGNIGEIFALAAPPPPVTVDTVTQPQLTVKYNSDTIYLPFAGNLACIPSAGSQKNSSQSLLSGFGLSDTTGSGATLLDKPYAAAEMQNGVLMPITFSPCQAQDLFGHVLNSLGSSTK